MRNDILIDRAVAAYYRAGGPALVRAQYSGVAIMEMEDGRQRLYACLNDHTGIKAIYAVRKGGRLALMRRWPAWIVANDRDPEWRRWCWATEGQRMREEQQQGAHLSRLVERHHAPPPIELPANDPLPVVNPSSRTHWDDLEATLAELDQFAA